MSGDLYYRVAIRDNANTFDELVLSSYPSDDNPFLSTEPPHGDGESIDPLGGKVGLADYVIHVADEIGTLNTSSVVMDEQWDYEDADARDAVWPTTSDQAGSYSYTFLTEPQVTVNGRNGGYTGSAGDYGTGIAFHSGITYGGGIGGGNGFGKSTRTLTGLTAGGHYTVVCDRVRLSRAKGALDNCGISVNGGEGVTPADLDGPVTIEAVANGSGELTIALGHFDLEFGMGGMAMTFDRIRVYGTGSTVEARVITALQGDSGGRWTGVNRVATLFESTDGSTWTPVFVGWLTQATLTGGIEWELHLGDSDRRERRARALTVLPTVSGTNVWRGGTVIRSRRWHVHSTTDTDSGLPANTVVLESDPEMDADEVSAINKLAAPFASGSSPNITFPTLRAIVTTPAGVTVGSFEPWGLSPQSLFDFSDSVGRGSLLLGLSNNPLMLKWSGTLPAEDTEYVVEVDAATNGPTEDMPYVFIGHPVVFATSLMGVAGAPFDQDSADEVQAALGLGLQVTYTFTAVELLMGLLERAAFGPYGFAIRKNSDNVWEFYLTRRLPDTAPSVTIGDDDIHSPEQVTFDATLENQVTQVTWDLKVTAGTVTDRFTSVDAPISDYGVHEQVYDLPGSFVSFGEDFEEDAEDIPIPAGRTSVDVFRTIESQAILDRWGRGAPYTDISVLRSVGLTAKIGDFILLDLSHKPILDLDSTPTGVRGGNRILQIVQRTLQPEGWQLRLLDAGITADPDAPTLPVPEFMLAQGTDTRHSSTATLTNDGDLTGYLVQYQVSTGSTEPTGGTLLTPFTPDAVAHDLPDVPAGSTVWVRARVLNGSDLPGDWSDWDSVDLDVIPPVTDLATSAGANDTERVITWTVGDATLQVRVRWKATADATYYNVVILPAGSTTYTITGIVPGTAMTVAVDHVDVSPWSGFSAVETATWTAGSTTPTLDPPTDPFGFSDGNGIYGLDVTAGEYPGTVEYAQAVEDSVGAGTYGSFTTVGTKASVTGGPTRLTLGPASNNGLTYQLKARQIAAGYTASAYTTAVVVDPWDTQESPSTGGSSLTQTTDGDTLYAAPLGGDLELVGITTGRVALQYSTDNATWQFLDSTGDDEGPYVSAEVAGLIAGAWATLDDDAKADVWLRVVAVDATSTVTALGTPYREKRYLAGVQRMRVKVSFTTAGAFATDPVIDKVSMETSAVADAVTPPPDPDPPEGASAPPDSYPVARGLLAWHIADHADNTYTGIGAGNNRVSTLADLSGNGNHLTDDGTAEGPTEPIYITGGAIAAQNGRQPVNYGGNQGYSVWPTTLFDGVTEAELFIVVRAAGGDPNGHFSGISWADGCWKMGPGASGSARWARRDSSTTDSGGISEDFGSSTTRDLGDAPGSLSGFRIYNVRVASGVFVAALDGTVFYTDSSNTPSFSTAPTIGQQSKGCNIDIAEIAIHSVVLTTDERALVVAALQDRWAL